MRSLLTTLLLLLPVAAMAQTGSLCYFPDKTKQAQRVCIDVTPETIASAKAFIAAENAVSISAGQPAPWSGVGALIAKHNYGLFASLIDAQPTVAILAAKARRDAERATIESLKAAAVAATVVGADPQ